MTPSGLEARDKASSQRTGLNGERTGCLSEHHQADFSEPQARPRATIAYATPLLRTKRGLQ
jgi:hypothetical protein